ncbi:MAG: Gfo/Idh/MocA family oxidoreductase [Planctomycetales bacterium]|nr:Gfo/Idh/MocA family oxidoreductase [Planctomycetales bacterium]
MSDHPSKLHLPRREFLQGASAAAAGGMLLGASAKLARGAAHPGGSDEIKVAVIGCGGRGTGAACEALETKGPVTVVAMADAFADNLDRCRQQLNDKVAQGKAENNPLLIDSKVDCPPERRFVGFDAYKQALETDADLVILATPPGFRPLHFAAAVDAGKHIFAEKPLAVDGAGVRAIMDANQRAKDKNLMVAIGLQRHHDPRYVETIQRIHDGAIGDVLATRVYWNSDGVWVRNRKPEYTEMEYQMRNWYYFNWLCGDHYTEQHIHNLDVGNWIRGGKHPVRCVAMGGRQVRTGKDTGQIFDHFAAEFTYDDDSKMFSQARHIPGCWSEVGEAAHGSRGTADVSRFRMVGHEGRWRSKLPGVQAWHQEHHDLFAALRRGDIYNEGDNGAVATMTAVLGVMAAYSGKELTWDEVLNSDHVAAPGIEGYAFDTTPPVTPNADGYYPVPMPGKTDVLKA